MLAFAEYDSAQANTARIRTLRRLTLRGAGLGMHSFQKNATFLHSFAFFSKERNVLAFFCVLYIKNAAFFAFFYNLYKRTLCSLRSFTFFKKEHGVLCILLHSL